MKLNMDIFKNEKDVRQYAPGDVIFTEGDAGDFMGVVLEGQVELLKGSHPFDVMEPGSIFGELALIDNSPRSATVRALTTCRIAHINEHRFLFLVRETPFFALRVMSTMADRLRKYTPTEPGIK